MAGRAGSGLKAFLCSLWLTASLSSAGVIHLRAKTIKTEEMDPIKPLDVALQDTDLRPYLVTLDPSKGLTATKDRITKVIHEALEEYIPENTFMVLANHEDIYQVQQLDGVVWVGEYKAEYKVSPSLGNSAKKLSVLLGHDSHRGSQEGHEILAAMRERCSLKAVLVTSNLFVVNLEGDQVALDASKCCAQSHEVVWVEERLENKAFIKPVASFGTIE